MEQITRIAVFLSKGEHIFTFAPIYPSLSNAGYKVLLFDITEEEGWFEKGVHYASLNYDKPVGIINFNWSAEKIRDYVTRSLSKNEVDLIILIGYNKVLLSVASLAMKMSIPTLHLGSGVRSYKLSEDEMMRQLIDHLTPFHVTYSANHYGNMVFEGFEKEYISLTNHPIMDFVSASLSDALSKSFILNELNVNPNEYLFVYLSEANAVKCVDYLKDFAVKSGEFLILQLPKKLKKQLMESGRYYEYMENYGILYLEILDYIDSLTLMYNSKGTITDTEWIALQSLALNKPTSLILEEGATLSYISEGDANIVPCTELLTESLLKVYGRPRGKPAAGHRGSTSTEALHQFLKNIEWLPVRYPAIALYEKRNNEVTKHDISVIPNYLRAHIHL